MQLCARACLSAHMCGHCGHVWSGVGPGAGGKAGAQRHALWSLGCERSSGSRASPAAVGAEPLSGTGATDSRGVSVTPATSAFLLSRVVGLSCRSASLRPTAISSVLGGRAVAGPGRGSGDPPPWPPSSDYLPPWLGCQMRRDTQLHWNFSEMTNTRLVQVCLKDS